MRLALVGVGQAGGEIVDEFLRHDRRAAGNVVRSTTVVDTAEAGLHGLELVPREDRILVGTWRVDGHGVGRALLSIAGSPDVLDQKGIERARNWLVEETGGTGVRYGDHPLRNEDVVAAADLLSGLTEVPRSMRYDGELSPPTIRPGTWKPRAGTGWTGSSTTTSIRCSHELVPRREW